MLRENTMQSIDKVASRRPRPNPRSFLIGRESLPEIRQGAIRDCGRKTGFRGGSTLWKKTKKITGCPMAGVPVFRLKVLTGVPDWYDVSFWPNQWSVSVP
jgi:hypothetical protein